MSQIIIDQILKFFEKSKNWILSGERNAQIAKDNIPNIPVVVAQKSALLSNSSASHMQDDSLSPDITQNITSGITFWAKSTDQTVPHSKAKYTTILKRAKLFKLGPRGRGRGA